MPNAPIVGLVGFAQAGKDTFAGYLGYKRIAFADTLRSMAIAINPVIGFRPMSTTSHPIYLASAIAAYGYETVKQDFPEARRFLQRLGTEGIRQHVSDSFWVDKAMAKVEAGVPSVFTDVRFPNEIAAVRERGGVIVRIQREGQKAVNGHVSELAWQTEEPDFTVFARNGDFAALKAQAVGLDQALRDGSNALVWYSA